MEAVIKEYGNYIVAAVAGAIVIGAVCLLLGFFDTSWLDAAGEVMMTGDSISKADVANVAEATNGHNVEILTLKFLEGTTQEYSYDYKVRDGNGLLGKFICELLNRIM